MGAIKSFNSFIYNYVIQFIIFDQKVALFISFKFNCENYQEGDFKTLNRYNKDVQHFPQTKLSQSKKIPFVGASQNTKQNQPCITIRFVSFSWWFYSLRKCPNSISYFSVHKKNIIAVKITLERENIFIEITVSGTVII